MMKKAGKKPSLHMKKAGKKPSLHMKKAGKKPSLHMKKAGKKPSLHMKKAGKKPSLHMGMTDLPNMLREACCHPACCLLHKTVEAYMWFIIDGWSLYFWVSYE